MSEATNSNTSSNNETSTKSVLEALRTNAPARTGARFKACTYTMLVPEECVARVNKQCIALYATLADTGETTWTEEELHEVIVNGTHLVTKQSPWRIFKYYRATLIDAGLLEMSK